MKHYIIIVCVLIFSGCQHFSANEHIGDANTAEIKRTLLLPDKTEHDFGELTSGEEVAAIFGFKNAGESPLIVEDVKAGCGCTNIKFPKQPIQPGERGSIEVTFDTKGRNGNQRQAIRVYSNGSKESILLIIRANVR